MSQYSLDIEALSPHLFWDVDRSKLDVDKHRRIVVQRVLEYGLMNDWKLIYRYYGIEDIAAIATTLRELDERAVSFISMLAHIPKEEFLCYTTRQSTPRHWNF